MTVVATIMAAACGPGDEPPQLIENAVDSTGVITLAQTSSFPMSIVIRDGAPIDVPDERSPIPRYPVAMDSRDRLYTSTYDQGRIAVWDTTGSLIGTFGAPGEGPNELVAVDRIAIGVRDSVYVSTGSKIVVFSPSLEPVREMRVPMQPQYVLPLQSGRVVMQHHSWAPELVGWRFHVVDPRGGISDSFGRFERVVDQQRHAGEVNRIPSVTNPARDGIWGVEPTLYEINLWLPGRKAVRTLRRDVPWFRPYVERLADEGMVVPPRPLVATLHMDREELLWVAVRLADPDWKPVPGAKPGVEVPVAALEARNPVELFDERLEVIDPARGAVLASSYLPDLDVEVVLGHRIGLRRTQVREGIPSFQFVSLRVVPR